MKTFKLQRVIRFFGYILLSIVVLQSCGYRTPIIDGKVPFVVYKIVRYDETHSKYFAANLNSGALENAFSDYPIIILPSKIYNIGDTIKCSFNNH